MRYTTPGQCEQAAYRLRRTYWRDKRRDTVVYAPATDSVPAPVVEVIRQCASHFSVESVKTRELLDLAQLYIWSNQDDLAQKAMDRLQKVDAKLSVTDRGWKIYLYTKTLLNAFPTRMATGRTYLARLDAMGAPASTWRLFAHNEFSGYASSLDDTTMAESEARAGLAASKEMSADDRADWVYNILSAYQCLLTPIERTRGSPRALAVLDTALTDLLPSRPAGSREAAVLRGNIEEERAMPKALFTGGLKNVHATVWFGANGDTIRPKPGVTTLLVAASASCGGNCYPMYATIRRLHETYGSKLDIIMLTTTAGYFRSQPIPSPKIEADSVGHYWLTYLKLPVTGVVETTDFTHLDDGRRLNAETRNQREYFQVRPALLLDGNGVIRWMGRPDPNSEAIWNHVIRETLDRNS